MNEQGDGSSRLSPSDQTTLKHDLLKCTIVWGHQLPELFLKVFALYLAATGALVTYAFSTQVRSAFLGVVFVGVALSGAGIYVATLGRGLGKDVETDVRRLSESLGVPVLDSMFSRLANFTSTGGVLSCFVIVFWAFAMLAAPVGRPIVGVAQLGETPASVPAAAVGSHLTNWLSLGVAVATLIVFICSVYLIRRQLKHMEEDRRLAMYNEVVSGLNQMNLAILDHPGSSDHQSGETISHIRFAHFERLFVLHERQCIDEVSWEAEQTFMKDVLSRPGQVDIWNECRDCFRRDFRDFLDSMVPRKQTEDGATPQTSNPTGEAAS
ncbi:MAG: hypothetical protein IPJ41_14710 [Phycisphaerales bacterium]|nr:hypothetical protein [Phycisphaerales bacterium]